MKAHNKLMQDFLKLNGIDCKAKLHETGSLKGQWRFTNLNVKWHGNKDLQAKFIKLGFTSPYAYFNDNGHGINDFNGNGGIFQVWFVHNDFKLSDLYK